MVHKKRKGKKKKKHFVPEDDPSKRPPKSFIFRRGKVGSTVKQLVEDLRQVMRPNTAVNLKESSKNTLKDFIDVAGPLGVTHFLIFSATELATYMRLMKTPQGPTLTFRLLNYSLIRDISRFQARPYNPVNEYKTAPLLVLNNFGSEERHVKLMSIAFQNMFSTINIHTFRIEDCKRVVLLYYDKETEHIHLRHYVIRIVPVGLSKSIKRVVQKRIESLEEFEDVADYVAKGSGASESDLEDATGESHVDVENPETSTTAKRAIRLHEIGPRMELQLLKIEEGACDGTVLYHRYVNKSFAEMEALAKKKAEQRKMKEAKKKQEQVAEDPN